MLSAAVNGMVEYGWETNFCTCKRISILDQQAGVVGSGELVFEGPAVAGE